MGKGKNGGTFSLPEQLKDLRLEPVDGEDKIKLGSKAACVEDLPAREVLQEATAALCDRLTDLQEAFHADGSRALLLVLQGRDASGKDGVIKSVSGAFNPSGVRISSFGPPTPLELRHDFLWRVHEQVPPRGVIGVFNRSHYEDVLVARVRKLVPESVWRGRYALINAFEELLAESGVVVRKCMLHVSREEQGERLRERLHDPHKAWKFRLGDLDDRALWDDYTEAYKDALRQCSTKAAPWYIVPSDDNKVRNFLVARMLVETMESLDSKYPPMDPKVREAAVGFH
jgi:PPK2 family polyphosphate:nucleotide phosphotransferase